MTLFNRVCSVEVTLTNNQRIRISGLRVSFQVEKTEDSTPNKTTIEIYNLSEDTRNKLREASKSVTLYAGYSQANGEEIVFVGDVTSIIHTFSPPDIITEISAQDGKESFTNSKIIISETEGASARSILNKILASFQIGNNATQVSFEDKKYPQGFCFSGYSRMAMDKVCKFLGISWSIQNGRIIITKFDSNDQTGVLYINKDSGLVGSPKRILDDKRKVKGLSLFKTKGWAVETLLFPSITPRSKIILQSREIKDKTEFTVISIVHNGDTHGSSWNSSIEVKE